MNSCLERGHEKGQLIQSRGTMSTRERILLRTKLEVINEITNWLEAVDVWPNQDEAKQRYQYITRDNDRFTISSSLRRRRRQNGQFIRDQLQASFNAVKLLEWIVQEREPLELA